ncbi:hypothetical protein [Ruegeria sp.]|uniref:hypothetical protein n=1 Tax=Ruegeria sp. TaxID=1879320 RepID=UPI00230B1ACC|nr:hypothetical protein [Ruegeria sp.]MDA7965881.1 hypothetical protein [Ruegeria sp.]
MLNKLKALFADESGAVTVDWVLITAAVVGLGGLMYSHFHEPLRHIDEQTGQALANIEIDPIILD